MLTENNTISQKPNNGYGAKRWVSLGMQTGGATFTVIAPLINMVMCSVRWQRGSCIHGQLNPLGGCKAK